MKYLNVLHVCIIHLYLCRCELHVCVRVRVHVVYICHIVSKVLYESEGYPRGEVSKCARGAR